MAVVDGVVAMETDPKAGHQVISSHPELGMFAKRLEAFLQPVDEGCGLRRVVPSDEGPDIGEVVFGLFG